MKCPLQIACKRGLGRIVQIYGGGHLAHSLASEVGSAKYPCVPTCISKGCCKGTGWIFPEIGFIEECLPSREVLFHASEVTAPVAHGLLQRIDVCEANGITFPK